MLTIRIGIWVAGWALLVTGCGGGDQFAPVSGVVQLDGKPVVGASVSFEPVVGDTSTYGPGSHGITDNDGRFNLKVSSQNNHGALIGKHVVRISLGDAPKGDPGGAHLTKELLPARYNGKSDLSFDVPRGGSRTADFNLKSR